MKSKSTPRSRALDSVVLFVLVATVSVSAQANAFEVLTSVLTELACAISGPIAAALIIIAIAAFGMTVAVFESGPILKSVAGLICGAIFALSAPSVIASFTGTSRSLNCSGSFRAMAPAHPAPVAGWMESQQATVVAA